MLCSQCRIGRIIFTLHFNQPDFRGYSLIGWRGNLVGRLSLLRTFLAGQNNWFHENFSTPAICEIWIIYQIYNLRTIEISAFAFSVLNFGNILVIYWKHSTFFLWAFTYCFISYNNFIWKGDNITRSLGTC